MAVASRKLLEKLGQAGDQAGASTNDVQSALVLMFFQNFVQSAFKLIHSGASLSRSTKPSRTL